MEFGTFPAPGMADKMEELEAVFNEGKENFEILRNLVEDYYLLVMEVCIEPDRTEAHIDVFPHIAILKDRVARENKDIENEKNGSGDIHKTILFSGSMKTFVLRHMKTDGISFDTGEV